MSDREIDGMGERFTFDYYYGLEAEQFSFIRVPRALFTEKHFMRLSSDAKLLYGIMLERMGLSWKNHWVEEDTNRVYIVFTVREVCEKLNCGKDKAVKVLAELDCEKGIGLIERQRKGLGRPDTIYVKNFVAVMGEKESANPDGCAEFGKTEFKSSEKSNSEVRENRPQEFGFSDPNYINLSYTDESYTERSYTNPIHLSGEDSPDDGLMDRMDETDPYVKRIRKNLEYDHYIRPGSGVDRELYKEIYRIICDAVRKEQKTIRIGRQEYPCAQVRERFLELDSSHVEYVMASMKKTTTKINDIRAYLLTALYNAPTTMNYYYQQEAQHDLYGGV